MLAVGGSRPMLPGPSAPWGFFGPPADRGWTEATLALEHAARALDLGLRSPLRLTTETKVPNVSPQMNTNRWTLVLLRGGSEGVAQWTVRGGLLRAVPWVFGCAMLVALCAVAAAVVVAGGDNPLRVIQLARENRLLEDELEEAQARLANVGGQVAGLVEQNRRVRLLAGLSGIDQEVLEVGVGGPGLESSSDGELWMLDSEASETAYAIHYDLELMKRKADLLAASFDEVASSFEAQRRRAEATPSIFPVRGLLSSRFSRSRRHPLHDRRQPHEGIDIHAPKGAPIVAAAKGVVRSAGRRSGYGYTVVIDHGFGVSTLYAHASELLVRRGKAVRRGDVVARVGSTGISTAPHLHYEVHVNGSPVNPLNYVLGDALP